MHCHILLGHALDNWYEAEVCKIDSLEVTIGLQLHRQHAFEPRTTWHTGVCTDLLPTKRILLNRLRARQRRLLNRLRMKNRKLLNKPRVRTRKLPDRSKVNRKSLPNRPRAMRR